MPKLLILSVLLVVAAQLTTFNLTPTRRITFYRYSSLLPQALSHHPLSFREERRLTPFDLFYKMVSPSYTPLVIGNT
ncbi:hypothetical protein XELAEV_18028171mg [Xenopus laevis]|uniref:Uncharacterized protein n=1 Tax=Xenopus laevis TaxID=8355 RepID=A0A974CXM9_XENLA|nr:hypothetical protein XELAEV_18028171mg [Xenopus laevis]